MSKRKIARMDKLPRMREWTCDCIACCLVRAGACLECAGTVYEQVEPHREEIRQKGSMQFVANIHRSCREAVQNWLAYPERYLAKPDDVEARQ